MASDKHHYRVLIIGGNEKVSASLAGLLPASDYEFLHHAENAAQARRITSHTDVDLAIIISPLKDEFGNQLAVDLSEDNIGVLLIVHADIYDQICYKVEEFGVMTLAKPITRQSFYSAVRLLSAMRNKLTQMEQKQLSLQKKMMDVRTVNRAKWLLISELGITEDEAHYRIEKLAMNERISRGEAAERIIREYGE